MQTTLVGRGGWGHLTPQISLRRRMPYGTGISDADGRASPQMTPRRVRLQTAALCRSALCRSSQSSRVDTQPACRSRLPPRGSRPRRTRGLIATGPRWSPGPGTPGCRTALGADPVPYLPASGGGGRHGRQMVERPGVQGRGVSQAWAGSVESAGECRVMIERRARAGGGRYRNGRKGAGGVAPKRVTPKCKLRGRIGCPSQ